MIGETNVGSGAKAFALIGVTYPAGSTCTCTGGAKTLKLKDTSGQGIFIIPYAATWTVTATNGTNTKSQTVEITAEGQSFSVTLSYELVLFADGVISPELGELIGQSSSGGAKIENGRLKLGGDSYAHDTVYFTGGINPNAIGYTTLKILVYSSAIGGTFGLSSSASTTIRWVASQEYAANLTDEVVSCPIESVNTTCYLSLESKQKSSPGRVWSYISKIWLE